jgi:hypothetical protein
LNRIGDARTAAIESPNSATNGVATTPTTTEPPASGAH